MYRRTNVEYSSWYSDVFVQRLRLRSTEGSNNWFFRQVTSPNYVYTTWPLYSTARQVAIGIKITMRLRRRPQAKMRLHDLVQRCRVYNLPPYVRRQFSTGNMLPSMPLFIAVVPNVYVPCTIVIWSIVRIHPVTIIDGSVSDDT
jgi:hypothetical protein